MTSTALSSHRPNLLTVAALLAALTLGGTASAASSNAALDYLDANEDRFQKLALDIWSLAELGYLEEKSADLLRETLVAEGFSLREGVADIPTAFIAEWGKGGPVIAILAEFDALPGLSQAAVPERQPLASGSGHGCGHHLFGTASVAAAIAVKRQLADSGRPGRVRLYGTPAEEGGSGKVYMVRAGLFKDVAVALHWHPSDRNDASPGTTNANRSARFRFEGVSAHAAASPEQGRSALDGVEAMNYMTNLMREHMPGRARLHYIISDGGKAPNVVPDIAEAYYYVRHPEAAGVEELFARVVKAAEGAALGTGTRMSYEIMHGNHPLLPNDTLSRLMDTHLRQVGGITYSRAEKRFAEKLQKTLVAPKPLALSNQIQPYQPRQSAGSTDVGDLSWNVPTVGLRQATWVPGTPAHSWQAVAAGGMSIGTRGMLNAARVLALTALNIYESPDVIATAQRELEGRRGANWRYQPLLGDRKPPLDYRR